MASSSSSCCLAAPLQVDDTDVINFLLSTEIIPLCLRTMEMGSELSKTVATFIVQKILLDDVSAGSWPRGVACRSCCWLCGVAGCWLHPLFHSHDFRGSS